MWCVSGMPRCRRSRLILWLAFFAALIPSPRSLRAGGGSTSSGGSVQPQTGAAASEHLTHAVQQAAAGVPRVMVTAKAIQASSRVERYSFRFEQRPATATIEGEVDVTAKSAHLRMTLARRGVPPVDLWLREGQAYAKHAYLNRYFKVKGPVAFPDYLSAAVALAQRDQQATPRAEGAGWKLDVLLDVSATSQRIGEQLEGWLKSAKTSGRPELAQKLLTDLAGLSASVQIGIAKGSYLINRIVIDTQGPRARSSAIISISPGVETTHPLPAEALRSAGPALPLGALFYRVRSIQGWCRNTHRFFAAESLNLIKSEDAASGLGRYNEIYDNGKIDVRNQEDQTFNPLIIGSDYEDCADGDDMTKAHQIYASWLDSPQDYLKPGIVRDYRHFGGDGQGLERIWLMDLRDGDSTPDVGDRFYSARDWGYGVTTNNLMTFRGAITQFAKGSYRNRKAAYLMLGHVVHLLQDQGMPDHAALISHPGSSYNDPQLYDEIPLCDILAGEIMVMGCGFACPPLDLFCYLACAAATSAAAESSKLACEAGIDPDEVGYERVVVDQYAIHYAQASIAARVAQVGSVRHGDYNGYFHEVAALSRPEPAARGLSQPLGLGGHPATAIVDYPVDPYIHESNASETRPFLELTDAVAVPIITRSAGLMKHFLDIVNPPPYVSALTIRQNNEIRFQVIWNAKFDQATPRREAARINKALYPGIQAVLELSFGPVGLDGRNREMATVALTLDGQALALAHELNGPTHLYRATFTPPCTGSQVKSMQISISGTDNAAHLGGRTPLGNALDRAPASYARVQSDPPYAFTGYESDGPYTESITVGPTPSCWKDVTEQSSCGDPVHWPWWQLYKGKSMVASLSVLEQGSDGDAPSGAASCGRYRLSLGSTIRKLGTSGGPAQYWEEGPPSQFGLTLAIDDPHSSRPKITITHNQASSNALDMEVLQFRVPVTLSYEPVTGPAVQLCRAEQELRVLGIGQLWRAVRDCVVAKHKWARWVGPWEEVENPREEIQRVDLSHAVHSGSVAEVQRVASYYAKLEPAAGHDVLFISALGESRELSLQEAGIKIARTSDPHVLTVEPSAHTALGRYVIPFSAQAGGAAQIVVVVNVTK
jgi:hypothetical protein